VDEAPYTGDLDLEAVTSRDELVVLLRTVHLRADKPSLRTLENNTRHQSTPLSKTTVSEMLKGERLPRKAVMVAFLQACGVPDGLIEPWQRAWERIAGEQGSAGIQTTEFPVGAERRHLPVTNNADNEGRPRGMAAVRRAAGTIASTAASGEGEAQLRELVDQLNRDNVGLRLQLAVAEQRAAAVEFQRKDAKKAPETRSPTVRRRELGGLLRSLRTAEGLTVEQVAERLMCSPSKVSRMETGYRGPTIRDIRDLCDLYGVTSISDRDFLMELARESKQQGWWRKYSSTDVGAYVAEEEAASIKRYDSTIVPGLLQTADYARAGFERAWPRHSPNTIEQQVEARFTRQRMLIERSDSVQLQSILDEAVLHRVVGGSTVMRAQLDRLIEVSELANVTIQVMPYEIGAHPATDSNFSILDFIGSMPSVVYVEGLVGTIYLERPEDLERYNEIYQALHAVALSSEESIELILKMRRSLKE
jgi:transcriptional regulator with XRE-family HTH domain